jgi:DNA-binding transcriptional LysR family regulator
MRMINLRLLALAVALEQHRNFGRAADAVNLSQPSFSRGIAALESECGTRLFDRTNRGVEPTDAGKLLLSRARSLLMEAAGLQDALKDLIGLQSGRLSVAAGPYALEISVEEAVARLTTLHPQLQLELIEGKWLEIAPKLLGGEVDIGVMDTTIVIDDSRFTVEQLPTHTGVFYCRAGHPLAGGAPVSLAELLTFPLVGTVAPQRAMPPIPPGSYGMQKVPATGELMPHTTTTSVAAARAIIGRTNGIGMAFASQVANELQAGTFVVLDVECPPPTSAYGIVYLKDRTLPPAAAKFIAILKEVEAELIAGSS